MLLAVEIIRSLPRLKVAIAARVYTQMPTARIVRRCPSLQ